MCRYRSNKEVVRMRAGRSGSLVLLGLVIGAAGMWGATRLVGEPLAPPTRVHVYTGTAYTDGARQVMELFAPKPVNGFPLVGPDWRDSSGSWHDRGPVACLHFGRTAHVT